MAEAELVLPLIYPLVTASLIGLTFKKASLSPLVGYVVGGIIVGSIFKLVNPAFEILAFLSELGIILISFDIGLYLKLDFSKEKA